MIRDSVLCCCARVAVVDDRFLLSRFEGLPAAELLSSAHVIVGLGALGHEQ